MWFTEVHAGPAKFEFGDDEFVDWVDGQARSWSKPYLESQGKEHEACDMQAMLYRLKIGGDDNCQYKNRLLLLLCSFVSSHLPSAYEPCVLRWLDTWNHRMHREAWFLNAMCEMSSVDDPPRCGKERRVLGTCAWVEALSILCAQHASQTKDPKDCQIRHVLPLPSVDSSFS